MTVCNIKLKVGTITAGLKRERNNLCFISSVDRLQTTQGLKKTLLKSKDKAAVEYIAYKS